MTTTRLKFQPTLPYKVMNSVEQLLDQRTELVKVRGLEHTFIEMEHLTDY